MDKASWTKKYNKKTTTIKPSSKLKVYKRAVFGTSAQKYTLSSFPP